ncbi:MAG: rhomboid family intramembrane serine protease [Verrucomicrobia bacterium]|nr:rhomboid family intramembrane serine protease [Verrucomicrobiota bacterium]
MLYDRSYMRDADFRPRHVATTTLLISLVVIFVATSLVGFWVFKDDRLDVFFGLSLAGVKKGWVWQFVTYSFLHGGVWHLICNGLMIFFCGRVMEEVLGSRGFLKLYFVSCVAGAALQIAMAFAVPDLYGKALVIGASGAAMGLLAAFATMFPHKEICLYLFFVFPITLLARTLLWFFGALSLFGMLVPLDGVAHAAHMGGLLAGIVFVKGFVQREEASFDWNFLRKLGRKRELVRTRSGGTVSLQRVPSDENEELPPAEFISQEVDPILDKISAHGIHSLTERERKILAAARERMSKR